MWLVAESAAKSPIKITTMRLFDNQKGAEVYANNMDAWRVICYYFKNPNEKYIKRWEYTPHKYMGTRQTPANNADFTP